MPSEFESIHSCPICGSDLVAIEVRDLVNVTLSWTGETVDEYDTCPINEPLRKISCESSGHTHRQILEFIKNR